MKRTLFAALLVAIAYCLTGFASAATITWQTPVPVDQNNVGQVLTNGVQHVDAITSVGTTTLNGIVFHGYSSGSGGAIDFGTSNITLTNSDVNTPGSFASTGTTTYGAALNDGFYRNGANSPNLSINLGNLTPGVTYQVQLWTPYWNNDFPTTYTAGTTSAQLHGLANPDYVVGTFVADSSTQAIIGNASSPSSYAMISAVSVNALTPEPSSLILCGLGAAGLLVAARRRGKA